MLEVMHKVRFNSPLCDIQQDFLSCFQSNQFIAVLLMWQIFGYIYPTVNSQVKLAIIEVHTQAWVKFRQISVERNITLSKQWQTRGGEFGRQHRDNINI